VWWVSGHSGQDVPSPARPHFAGEAGRSFRSHSMQGDPVPIWRSMLAVWSTGPSKDTVKTHWVRKNQLQAQHTYYEWYRFESLQI